MPAKDPRVDAYIAGAAPFARPILAHLRKLVHAACPEVTETIKWSRPHFEFRGPLGGMAAFKEHCTFGLWKESLIAAQSDGKGQEAIGQLGKIRSRSDLPNHRAIIACVRKAAELNQSGVKTPRRPAAPRASLAVPKELATALARNARAKKAFDAFSPSHRREYLEWITEAKRPETRDRRIATALTWLEEGKPRNWKYMPAKPAR